jgi:hypothetical protein
MPRFSREEFLPLVESVQKSIHRRHKTHVHVAMVFGRGKTLLAMAMNKVGSRSSGAGFSACMIHAERAALKRVGDISKLRGATLVVIRISSTGELRNSKPCSECECHLNKCIREYGLRRVFYS